MSPYLQLAVTLWCMGWLRLVGCLKIYVSLQNIGLFCRSLLQKRPIFLSILLIVATPYTIMLQPIADRVTRNFEIISKKIQINTRRTRILMGFIISTILLPGTTRKSHGQNSSTLPKFQEIIPRFCAAISVVGCKYYIMKHCNTHCNTTP